MKRKDWLILGVAALGALILFSKKTAADTGITGGGGGGLSDLAKALSGIIPLPSTAFGDVSPTTYIPPATPTYTPTLAAQLKAAGATAAATQTQTVGAGAMLAGSAYTVSQQGGIVKTLAQYGGYEAISPTGLGYSTASVTAAANIATGIPQATKKPTAAQAASGAAYITAPTAAAKAPVYQGVSYVVGKGFVKA